MNIKRAQVWTTDKRNPAAQLVRRHLGQKRSRIVKKPAGQIQGVGVMVVVGNGFQSLADGPRQVRSQIDVTICSPLPSPAG